MMNRQIYFSLSDRTPNIISTETEHRVFVSSAGEAGIVLTGGGNARVAQQEVLVLEHG